MLLCLALMVAATVGSVLQYIAMADHKKDGSQDDIFLPPVVSGLSSYYYSQVAFSYLFCF